MCFGFKAKARARDKAKTNTNDSTMSRASYISYLGWDRNPYERNTHYRNGGSDYHGRAPHVVVVNTHYTNCPQCEAPGSRKCVNKAMTLEVDGLKYHSLYCEFHTCRKIERGSLCREPKLPKSDRFCRGREFTTGVFCSTLVSPCLSSVLMRFCCHTDEQLLGLVMIWY